jgi:glycine betaine/proline transport system ATP-binding protein
MQGLLQDLQRDLKKTIVFITHDLDEALRLGDRIAVLKDGRLIQEGRPRDIVLQPADDYVRSFVGDVNRWRVLTAEDVMTPRDPERGTATDAVETSGAAGVCPETPLEDLLPALSDGRSAVPVVTADGIIVGDVTRERLFEAGGRPANRS